MALFKVLDIAGTALSAQSVRLNTTASNLANAESVSSSIDQTYRARHPVFQAVLREAEFKYISNQEFKKQKPKIDIS